MVWFGRAQSRPLWLENRGQGELRLARKVGTWAERTWNSKLNNLAMNCHWRFWTRGMAPPEQGFLLPHPAWSTWASFALSSVVVFFWFFCVYVVWFGGFLWFSLFFGLSLFLTVFHSIWSWLCVGNHAKLPARPQWAPPSPANPQLHQRWAPPLLRSPVLLLPPSLWWHISGDFPKYHLSFGG